MCIMASYTLLPRLSFGRTENSKRGVLPNYIDAEWIGTPGDVCAQGQLPFLTPYRGRAPPWQFFSSLGTTLFANDRVSSVR